MKIMNNAIEDEQSEHYGAMLVDISQCNSHLDSNLGLSCNSSATVSVINKLKDYLPVVKYCGYEQGCAFTGEYSYLHGKKESLNPVGSFINSPSFNNDIYYKMDFAEGSHVYIERMFDNGLFDPDLKTLRYTRTKLYYDMNGDKGPNRFGKDLFVFYFFPFQGRVVPYDAKLDQPANADDCQKGKDGLSCSVKVVLNQKY